MEADLERFYTPEISEFHVGFEFEISISRARSADNVTSEWCPVILDKGNGTHSDLALAEYMRGTFSKRNTDLNNSVRVKHLDREDIESLGFKITASESKPYGEYLQGKLNGMELWFAHLKGKTPYISLKSSHYNGNMKVYLKNKSELKRILRQIGV